MLPFIVRERIMTEETILERIETKSLKCFGYVLRMGVKSWPQFLWKLDGRRNEVDKKTTCK